MGRAMWIVIAVAVVVVLLPGVAFGQSNARNRVKVVTVCEVLDNLNLYANTAVLVVGRYERSVSLTDHFEFLTQDGCERPVVTERQVSPNKIQVFLYWEKGMPKPPKERLKLHPTVFAAELSVIRKTTILGFHKEPQFKKEGNTIKYSGQGDVPNEWAVAYGRIVADPNPGKKDNGFIGVPLGMIVEPYNFYCLNNDGTPIPDLDQKDE